MAEPVFSNSYAALPAQFYTRVAPRAVADPEFIALNESLAGEMGLDAGWLASANGLGMLSGNVMPDGAAPLAQVYAGHQFGGWSPQLGDGRANLIGDITGPDGRHWDIHLKGSGPTPYSRMGDGRAALGPVLREYIVSEAMAALGVPTTRALAAVKTGETVLRETRMPGAILTRVATSHIRVGTFQYFAAHNDLEAVRTLLDFAIARHYPRIQATDALGFLTAVRDAQAVLVAKWMSLGFIHGVMNTDNTHVGGITIDYGPCAFLDSYDPAKVFSSIDQFGRYAYQAQPEIIVWNLAQLATSLLPLIDPDREMAITAAQEVLHGFGEAYTTSWLAAFLPKIGIAHPQDGDIALVQTLLACMAGTEADYTVTFRKLAQGDCSFADWSAQWRTRLRDEPDPEALMLASNPAFIPRNHRIEEAIQAGLHDDFAPFHRLGQVLQTPYADQPGHDDLQTPPRPDEQVRATFCGT